MRGQLAHLRVWATDATTPGRAWWTYGMEARTAIDAIRARASFERATATERWQRAVGGATGDPIDHWVERLRGAGRLTLNFHPDRVSRDGRSVAAGLAGDGRYLSQWVTGISAGSRSAMSGGERERFERELFGDAYTSADKASIAHPVYGSLDLLFDDHGGSPRFGSSFLVLRPAVAERVTMCVGDSAATPRDVGTIDEPLSILAALAEQARRDELLNRELGVDVLLSALDGTYRLGRASRDLDGYIELQVHGGVSLAHDVESIVADPSFRGTEVERDLRAAADRFGLPLAWHCGSELHIDDVPSDFRGPTMPLLARDIARPDGVVDAHAVGLAAVYARMGEPTPLGDPPESELQQLKYLWHTLLAHGHDARDAVDSRRAPRMSAAALRFGDDPEQYDRARPTYPAWVFDELLDGLGPCRVLDVGCGTGAAATALVERGCKVVGVEPDARMAAVAERRGISVDVVPFEEWSADGREFDLVCSAQSWHWIDPIVGAARVASALRRGGRFGAFWCAHEHTGDVAAAIRRARGLPLHGSGRSSPDGASLAATSLRADPMFDDVRLSSLDFELTYTASGWLEVEASFGANRALADDVRARLFVAMAEELAALEPVTVRWHTTLVTATTVS